MSEEAVAAGEVEVIAPVGFMAEAISENVYAGNAMSRRAGLQYGRNIPSGPFGQVDSAIGKGLAAGTTGLIAPTLVIEEDFEEHIIDGVIMVFQNTPGTEAPAEMNTWFPEQKVFWDEDGPGRGPKFKPGKHSVSLCQQFLDLPEKERVQKVLKVA